MIKLPWILDYRINEANRKLLEFLLSEDNFGGNYCLESKEMTSYGKAPFFIAAVPAPAQKGFGTGVMT